MADRRAVVIDNGSGFLKAGLAGGWEPSVIFPAVVGKKKPNCRRASLADHYMGEEALSQRSNVTLRHPVERGVVSQWADMELVWDHAYQRVRANPRQQPVLVTDSVLSPPSTRRRAAETLLETYGVPGLIIADTSSLCLYAEGAPDVTTGLVLESGYSATYAVPIIEGRVMHSAVTRLDLGGNDLTTFLLRLVEARGDFFPPAKRESFAAVKEKLCYVATNFKAEEAAVKAGAAGIRQTYDLEGESIALATERFQCPESLFQPQWLRVDAVGVHQLVHAAIDKCAREWRAALYANVLVAGGGTCFTGFTQRLQAELQAGAPDVSVSVNSPDHRATLAWRGGAQFCTAPHARSRWITPQEYQEVGEDILVRKKGVFLSEGEGCEEDELHIDVASPRVAAAADSSTTTPRNAMYRDRKVPTPSLHSNTVSPRLPPSTTPSGGGGLRGGKLSRGATTTHVEKDSDRGTSQARTAAALSSVLSVRRVAEETRPASPGVYERGFHPTLGRTPELVDPEADDEVGPLRSSAKTRSLPGSEDFNCFRKLSLFDNLLDEVSTFRAAQAANANANVHSADSSIYDDPDDDKISWISTATHDSALIDKMRDDELLPGRSRSGIHRGESIQEDVVGGDPAAAKEQERLQQMRPKTDDSGDESVFLQGVMNAKGMPLPKRLLHVVPTIQITESATPHGSASSTGSRQASPVEIVSKPLKFTFD